MNEQYDGLITSREKSHKTVLKLGKRKLKKFHGRKNILENQRKQAILP